MTDNTYYTKYYAVFDDTVNHDRVDIYVKLAGISPLTIPEKLLLAENPLIISYPTKEFVDQLFGCGAKINIINDSSDFFKFDELFSVPERNCFIEIIKTINYTGVGGLDTLVYGQGPPGNATPQGDSSIYLFQGYVLPEMYTSSLQKNIKVTIPATDQLSLLDRYTPTILVDTSAYRSDEFLNAFRIIGDILLDTDISKTIDIHCDLENTNYVKDPSAATTVFDNVFFESDNFADKNNLLNDKLVMEMVLKPFITRCYYSNGKWVLDRVPDMGRAFKDYVTYNEDTSIQLYNRVVNKRIELSNHNILANSGSLTYQPGNVKIVTALNYKLAPSLVENYYYDAKLYEKEVSTNSTLPLPAHRKWMCSAPDASMYPLENYDDNNIDTGIFFAPDPAAFSDNISKFVWFGTQYMSTMFQFTPNQPNVDDTKVSVNYTYSVNPLTTDQGGGTYSVKGKFALRALDKNGNNWWVAKSNVLDTSTYWKSSLYTFDTIETFDSIAAKNFSFEIDEEIDISKPIDSDAEKIYGKRFDDATYTEIGQTWLSHEVIDYTYVSPQVNEHVGQLYLDIYPLSRTVPGGGGVYIFTDTAFGDVDVDVDVPIPDTIIESILKEEPNYFTGIKNFELDIFDTTHVQFTNGLYNIDSSGTYRSIPGWRTPGDACTNYIPLAYKFVDDLGQMYWKPRYGLDIDIRSNDSSLFTLGNIYTHNEFTYRNTGTNLDGSLLEFVCNGFEYNVKENTYRLHLLEYDQDKNWINAPYFSATPTDITFTAGDTNTHTIDISTNTTYTYGISGGWINLESHTTGTSMVISADANTGAARFGSVTFYPDDGLSNVTVNVEQYKEGTSVTFLSNGNLSTYGLGSNVVDMSILLTTRAQVTARGVPGTTFSQLGFTSDGNLVDDVSTTVVKYPTGTDISTHSLNINLIGVTDASVLDTDYLFGAWRASFATYDASAFASALITRCKIQGFGVDVSSIAANTYTVWQGPLGVINETASWT